MCKFVPVCRYLAVIAHCFYTNNKNVWVVECDKFETFFTIHCVFRKNEGDWGNSCKHICRHKESTLIDYHFFQDFSGKFFHSKAIDFFNFLSLYKCRKILTIKTTLRLVHTRRQVAATCRGDTLQRKIASCALENFVKIFVAATEFCRRNKSHRFCLIWFFATCCSDKFCCRNKDFHKHSPEHTKRFVAVSPYLVAATSRPTCTHGVIYRRDVLLQLVA